MDDLMLNFRLNIPLYAPRQVSHLCQPQNIYTADEMALKVRYRGLIRVLTQF